MIYIENKKLAVIGVDHGYGNIKTAGTVTPTGITSYDSEPVFNGNVLEYEGKYYRIGEGHKEFIPDKSSDEDFYLFTLAAVARELNMHNIHNADVHLAVGLPLTWVRTQRNSFSAYLLRKPDVEYRFNGREYKIRFCGCTVLPQGYPAIINKLDSTTGINILADIGNGTMNVLYIINKKPVESKSYTEKYGVNLCVINARNAVLDTLGTRIDDSVIEQVIRTGTAEISQKYLDCITNSARKYTAGIFDVLRRYEYNPDIVKLFVVGGGGCLIKNFAEYDPKRVVIINDICAAAKGFEVLVAHMQKGRDEP